MAGGAVRRGAVQTVARLTVGGRPVLPTQDLPVPWSGLWWDVSGASLRIPLLDAAIASKRPQEPTCRMSSDLVYRAWRIAVTLGPILAIALTLVAARRW